MKITKQGIAPQDVVWVGKCFKCNSEMEATRDELHDIGSCPREGYSFGKAQCPCCYAIVNFYPQGGK